MWVWTFPIERTFETRQTWYAASTGTVCSTTVWWTLCTWTFPWWPHPRGTGPCTHHTLTLASNWSSRLASDWLIPELRMRGADCLLQQTQFLRHQRVLLAQLAWGAGEQVINIRYVTCWISVSKMFFSNIFQSFTYAVKFLRKNLIKIL